MSVIKKRDPPKFDGDHLQYLEWKIKWKALISVHKPDPIYELDLLKENIPEQGRKNLFGCESLVKAFDLLDKLYGDQKLITQKLKSKLRNLKPVSTEPHEIVIEMQEEIDYLVKRLKALNALGLLDSDNDYLNCIYKNLPVHHQLDWDKFDTDDKEYKGSEWTAFQAFMSEIYQNALKKRTRVASLKDMKFYSQDPSRQNACYICQELGHKSPKCPKNLKNVKNEQVITRKVEVKPDKEENGASKIDYTCPCCKKTHMWKPKRNPKSKERPADRFYSCPEYRKLDVKSRGELLEKSNGCILCTSWSHSKDECSANMKVARCGEKESDGQECKKLHSRLLHGCDLPYCTSAKAEISLKAGTTNTFDDEIMDVNARTLTLLQDLQLANTKEVARSQFDNGSSRILVTHSFAKKAGLKELPAEYCMQVVGKGWETVKGVMYIFDFINRSGEKIKAWGYGIDVISDPVEPTDLTAVRAKFPHVPDAAFISLEKKPLDMLIGLNFLGIHPTGGEGINKAGLQ